ncbi:hypothetical protein Lal_00037411 [Lupinus albus]|uniref:Uncharacterized protein n=1 Tax=Lupinus albus TaxID=3870 RepID=A0A6A5P0Z6_LUPAL|nr:hypothetical protein Lalb_Chr18g0055871 [Lupinus albus]KAF1890841.1 hypothetical protein Lal_00037411 [Lupinus albus]
MGTEVLRPHDYFIERIRNPRPTVAAFSRRRSNFNDHNYNHNHYHASTSVKPSRKPLVRPDPKKRVEKKPSSDDSKMVRSSGFVMEKVMILRRGESLDSKIKSEALMKERDDLVLIGTQRLGPEPNGIPGFEIYAGSAFAMSPSPSALPLPSFHKKSSSPPAVIVDSATRDLRRLLRLE